MKVNIQFIGNDDFITSYSGNSEDLVSLRDNIVGFIDRTLGYSSGFKIRISNLNIVKGESWSKIPSIKAIREVMGYSLKDAKDLVERIEKTPQSEEILDRIFTGEVVEAVRNLLSPFFRVDIFSATLIY